MVIMLFPMIYRVLIYIFLLLSIIIISYVLFDIMCLLSGRFYLLAGHRPGVFTSLTKPILFLCCHEGLHIIIYLDDILVLVCSKRAGKRAFCFCVPCWSILVYISVLLKSDVCLSQTFCFLGLCWDIVQMSVSLPPDKLADIQQLTLSLLWTPLVIVHRVMSFLGNTNFCTNGHSQLWQLSCVIQSNMLPVYHSPTQLFSCVHFSLSSLCQLEQLTHLQQSLVPLQFPLPDVVIATDAMPTHRVFYFQGSGLPLLFSGSWLGSLCRGHITLKTLQAVCNQGGTVSPFLSQLAWQILNLTDKHGITLILVYIPMHLNVEADYLSWVQMLPEWHFLPQVAHGAFCLLGPSSGRPIGIFSFYAMPALLNHGNSTTSGGLGVECFQPSLDFSGKLCVSSSHTSFL